MPSSVIFTKFHGPTISILAFRTTVSVSGLGMLRMANFVLTRLERKLFKTGRGFWRGVMGWDWVVGVGVGSGDRGREYA